MTIKRSREPDLQSAEHHYRIFLEYMGYPVEDLDAMCSKHSGKNTARRAVEAYDEFLSKEQEHFAFTTFPWDKGSNQIIAITHMEFASLCAHHMLPYMGVAHVGYIPNQKVCGLSKIVRIVDHYSHRPSIQEDLTEKIATFLMEQLTPRGCGVVIEATHLCMALRGVVRPGHITVTSDARGSFLEPDASREFMSLINGAKFRDRR